MKKFLWIIFWFICLFSLVFIFTKNTSDYETIAFTVGFVLAGRLHVRAENKQLTIKGFLATSSLYVIFGIILFLLPEWMREKIWISNIGWLSLTIGALTGYVSYCEEPLKIFHRKLRHG